LEINVKYLFHRRINIDSKQDGKRAWAMLIKENREINPTDVADAILAIYVDKITLQDVEETKKKTCRKYQKWYKRTVLLTLVLAALRFVLN
jgi:hypothetical protein